LSPEEPEETQVVGSKSRLNLKSKFNPTPIPMVGRNKIPGLVELLGKMQGRMDESNKKMEMIVAAL